MSVNNNVKPIWVSHSSMGDFLSCPRAYYLKNIYKDPKSKNKIAIAAPPLSLGSAVHEVIEGLALRPVESRFDIDLEEQFELTWSQFQGEQGGFMTKDEEQFYKQRGLEMILRVKNNPGPLINKAVKLHSPDTLPPRFILSEEENIILCGKVDWMEYFSDDDSVHIIDFKTGKNEEKVDSMQLPIYMLLVSNCQRRKIRKISYWYLDRDDGLTEKDLPDVNEAYSRVLGVAVQVKNARMKGEFICPNNGCFSCQGLERIVSGQAKFIKSLGYQDIYSLN